VRGYLTWLAAADADGDPLTQARARGWAVRDYRTHLVTVAKTRPGRSIPPSPRSTTSTPAAASADRLDLPTQALRALAVPAARLTVPPPHERRISMGKRTMVNRCVRGGGASAFGYSDSGARTVPPALNP